jgi:hypothetical protein
VTDGESETGVDGDLCLAEITAELDAVQTQLDQVTDKKIPLLVATLRRIFGAEIDDIEELPSLADDLQERLVTLEAHLETVERQLSTFGDIETEPTSKDEKIAAVLVYATNKRDPEQSTVAVTAPEIKGCASVSRRYAYDLVDAIAEDVAGCQLRESTTVQTGAGAKHKPKAVLVDCEVVHGERGAVNSFTTGSATDTVTEEGRTTQGVSN